MKKARQFWLRILAAVLLAGAGFAQENPSGILNFLRVAKDVCTGGQPTMEQLAKLKVEGVKAIVNLRRASEYNAEEEAAKARELGLRYFHIPVNSQEPKDEQAEEFLRVMADPANRPVFIHCASANRVGAFWMIRRVLVDGWKLEDAVKEGERIGLRNPRTREFALAYIARRQPREK